MDHSSQDKNQDTEPATCNMQAATDNNHKAHKPMRAAADSSSKSKPAIRNRRFTIASSGNIGETNASSLGDVAVGRRRSTTYAEANSSPRRRSLAYTDLMAVFYPPNTLSQPLITESPFEETVAGDSASWEPTLERAIRSIVSIKAQCVRSFDTESSGTYTATGFVVDAQAGLILSNRHVVNPGPVVAQAVFVNYEEVELEPIYRDPIHDFGFFRFDPTKLQFMAAEEISLAPHKAKVGMEIRVVGNDAGEKLSILAGTLARLDRTAPEYGAGEYNDFNTFYMQAASGTSGGSSGSPVLDIYGDAVALNAGGSSKAASSFYLPLTRVVHALELIRHGQPVPRGTVQAELEHVPYDELRRLGLPVELETRARDAFPHAQGMLAVKATLPEGPADGRLRAGDIVLAVDGHAHVDFATLEAAVDAKVGERMRVSVWRGVAAHETELVVQDLHAITPSSYVEFGGGVVNNLSYQMARTYGVPVGGGVYVASSGHALGSAGAWRGSVVLRVGSSDTPDVRAFAQAVAKLHEGSRAPVRFFSLERPHKQRMAIMNVVTHWHALRMAVRDETSGLWIYEDLPRPLPVAQEEMQPMAAPSHLLPASLEPANRVWGSFVDVEFTAPFLVDGMRSTRFRGPGLIVDSSRGLVVCDRDTVPIAVGDVTVTVASSVVLPAKVVLLHPAHNFSIVSFDPRRLDGPPPPDLPVDHDHYAGNKRLEQGDVVHVVAVTGDQTPVVRQTRVAARTMVATAECAPPRFRCVNVEGVRLDDQPVCLGGVLCTGSGLAVGLWVSVSSQDSSGKDTTTMLGLDIALLRPVVDALRATGCAPPLRSLDVDLWPMRAAAARAMGLSAERIAQAEAAASSRRTPQLLYVAGLLAPNTPAAQLLNAGDVLLESDGKLLDDVSELAVVSAKAVDLVVLRDGHEISINVPTTELDAMETRRVVHWCGALVQKPYRAVLEQVRRLPSSVYISCTLYGSPANCYGLRPGMWIVEIEGRKVSTVDEFIETLHELRLSRCSSLKSGGSRYVRVTVVNKSLVTRVLSLRVDNHYWPPWRLELDAESPGGWKTIPHL
ncbi:hypothetical protein J3B02_002951 [Coemansia erecta]|uniref:PDZ domain-containing protein n=1 Tax=Coemansia asiatica TaxID=1052880 RepID=A0A9W7XQ31_9FUNG|nr:hypothetical protein LPJ64_001731 [Coemansia asiatica]KAJ2853844.1 hypothetical protein J3B02_002951 [Coemansia erecta]KAJ2885037.1 hypothetical protein FB639_001853 [Coemansia asiatica]